MIYITGDRHGDFDDIWDFCMENETTTDDILIILGDAGINYSLDRRDELLKESLKELPISLFCIHGNHEERPEYIRGYEEMEWHEGTVFYEPAYPNLIFAKDGEVYEFNGRKAIVIGGAYSVDKYARIRYNSPWYCSEQPSERTKMYVESQLERRNWNIDLVMSHTAPLKYEPVEFFLPFINQSEVDKSTEEWLDDIEERLDYEQWYFGHYHCEKEIDKIRIIYFDIEELE